MDTAVHFAWRSGRRTGSIVALAAILAVGVTAWLQRAWRRPRPRQPERCGSSRGSTSSLPRQAPSRSVVSSP